MIFFKHSGSWNPQIVGKHHLSFKKCIQFRFLAPQICSQLWQRRSRETQVYFSILSCGTHVSPSWNSGSGQGWCSCSPGTMDSLPWPGTCILGKSGAKDKGRVKKVKQKKLKRLFGVFMMPHFLRQNFWRKDHHKGPKLKPCDGRLADCKEFGKLAFNGSNMLMTIYWQKALNE